MILIFHVTLTEGLGKTFSRAITCQNTAYCSRCGECLLELCRRKSVQWYIATLPLVNYGKEMFLSPRFFIFIILVSWSISVSQIAPPFKTVWIQIITFFLYQHWYSDYREFSVSQSVFTQISDIKTDFFFIYSITQLSTYYELCRLTSGLLFQPWGTVIHTDTMQCHSSSPGCSAKCFLPRDGPSL